MDKAPPEFLNLLCELGVVLAQALAHGVQRLGVCGRHLLRQLLVRQGSIQPVLRKHRSTLQVATHIQT